MLSFHFFSAAPVHGNSTNKADKICLVCFTPHKLLKIMRAFQTLFQASFEINVKYFETYHLMSHSKNSFKRYVGIEQGSKEYILCLSLQVHVQQQVYITWTTEAYQTCGAMLSVTSFPINIRTQQPKPSPTIPALSRSNSIL